MLILTVHLLISLHLNKHLYMLRQNIQKKKKKVVVSFDILDILPINIPYSSNSSLLVWQNEEENKFYEF